MLNTYTSISLFWTIVSAQCTLS